MGSTSVKKHEKGTLNFKKVLLIGTPILIVLILLVLVLGFFKEDKKEIETNEKGEVSVRGELGKLSIEIADDFETSKSNNDNYKRYSLATDTDYCYVVIKSTQKGSYTSAKDYIEKNVYIEDIENVGKYKEEEINKQKWTSVNIDSDTTKTVQYATEKDEKIYSIEYVTTKDSGTCSKSIEKMIDSMEMK